MQRSTEQRTSFAHSGGQVRVPAVEAEPVAASEAHELHRILCLRIRAGLRDWAFALDLRRLCRHGSGAVREREHRSAKPVANETHVHDVRRRERWHAAVARRTRHCQRHRRRGSSVGAGAGGRLLGVGGHSVRRAGARGCRCRIRLGVSGRGGGGGGEGGRTMQRNLHSKLLQTHN